MPSFVSKIFSQLRSAGASLLSSAQKEFNRVVQVGTFDLDAHIHSSPFNNGTRGTKEAADWIKKQINTKEYDFYNNIMESGKLYYFRYPNPKHRESLKWFDANPLVLCLGHYISGAGDIIEIGINLHHLPLKVRRQVMVKVFNMFSSRYKGQMYREDQNKIDVKWAQLANALLPYGAAFAFRSYIPKRRLETIEFKYEDWYKAIFVPSLKYVGIEQGMLEAEWKLFTMTKSFSKMSANRLADVLGTY